jgi:hypothetical protein
MLWSEATALIPLDIQHMRPSLDSLAIATCAGETRFPISEEFAQWVLWLSVVGKRR